MTKIKKYYYESGKLHYEIPYTKDQKHGIIKHYYESGKVRIQYYYIRGDNITQDEWREYELIQQLAGG